MIRCVCVSASPPVGVFSFRGYAFRMCAARGTSVPSASSSANSKLLILRASRMVGSLRDGSAFDGSKLLAASAVRSSGAPDGYRPTSLAPSRSTLTPWSAAAPARKSRKPATSWRRRRNTRYEPSAVHAGPDREIGPGLPFALSPDFGSGVGICVG